VVLSRNKNCKFKIFSGHKIPGTRVFTGSVTEACLNRQVRYAAHEEVYSNQNFPHTILRTRTTQVS
jgi:hypothetical protein